MITMLTLRYQEINSEDKGHIDTRGKDLIDLCSGNDLRIVNGRTSGDIFGKKTCFQYNGSSLVDYVIYNKHLLKLIEFLKVFPLLPYLSDHCQISYNIKIKRKLTLENQNAEDNRHQSHVRLVFHDKTKDHIPTILNSLLYQDKMKCLKTTMQTA